MSGSDKVNRGSRKHAAILELARQDHRVGDELEIDNDAKISGSGPDGDNGCFVQAWLWVDFSGTEFDKYPEEDR